MLAQRVDKEGGGLLLVLELQVALVPPGAGSEGVGRRRAHECAHGQGEGFVQPVAPAVPYGAGAVIGAVYDPRLAQMQHQLDLGRLHLLVQPHDHKSSSLQVHFAHNLQHRRRRLADGSRARNPGQIPALDKLVPRQILECGQVGVADVGVAVGPDHVHGHLGRPRHQMRIT